MSLWALGVLGLLLLGNGGLAAARSALVNASKTRLRKMQTDGVTGAALALRVAEDSTALIVTARLAQTFCRFFIAGLAALLWEPPLTAFLRPALGAQAELAAVLLVFGLLAVGVVSLDELLPEAWALRAPETVALWAAPGVAALEKVLAGPVGLFRWLTEQLTAPLAGRRVPLVTEEEIKTLVDAGEEGGAIAEEQKEMIYSVFDFGNTPVREIMVPRMDMLALEVSLSLPEATAAAVAAGHSRIPIYEGTIDNIVGLLYAKDLLRVGRLGDPAVPFRQLLRPVYFTPETKKLDDLLAELQQQRVHMAIVVDEYGGVAGLVTLEDIVEEIVGEIRDEYDLDEEALYEQVSANEYIFDARFNWNEAGRLLKLPPVEDDDSDTLGGFIYSRLGHVPAPGEKVLAADIQFEVLTVSGRRIRKVRARRLSAPASAPPASPYVASN